MAAEKTGRGQDQRPEYRRLTDHARLAGRAWTYRRLIIQSFGAVIVARLALYLVPTRTVLKRSAVSARTGDDSHSPEIPAAYIAKAVRTVSTLVPGASCLTQALAARALFGKYGYPSQLQIGVRRSPAGALQAHAWVVVNGSVIIGGAGYRRFQRLPESKIN